MKILLANKFLNPRGGAETYTFKLGSGLQAQGHDVQYFGMDHKNRCVGNNANQYVTYIDFHDGKKLAKITSPIKTIYSLEARTKIRKVLEDFCPDVAHLNNFNYQLTPSIIEEIVNWRETKNKQCRIIYTAHDAQLVCPNHLLQNPNTGELCQKCIGGNYFNCVKGKCIHKSTARSLIGTLEAEFWHRKGTYQYIDTVLCPSAFMKSILDHDPILAEKTIVLHNFVEKVEWKETEKKDYVLYFGRYSEEKGIHTLITVCRELPGIQFVFAGSGPLESELHGISNIKNVGFQTGEDLKKLISEARFSVCPSEWYENYPFSIIESQTYGTPVLGANIGGIPELIENDVTGELFQAGNAAELKNKIISMWNDPNKLYRYTLNCKEKNIFTISQYLDKLIPIYNGK